MGSRGRGVPARAVPGAGREPKTCVSCGRSIEWRRKWADDWDEVRYCSKACRRNRPGPVDRRLEETIVELLSARAGSATICPSEAARAVEPDGWRQLMERSRSAARRLVAEERIVITQKGRVVDPSTAKGPIRLARGPAWTS
ncbi:MAG: DUF2256 and DUF3253 domain-containing protein [Actinomycetota bacterium]